MKRSGRKDPGAGMIVSLTTIWRVCEEGVERRTRKEKRKEKITKRRSGW
jgi:hypothetical protein